MTSPSLRGAFEGVVPADRLSDEPHALDAASGDESQLPGVRPGLVATPRSTAEVAALLARANERGVPVTPAGARTGKAGGAIPSPGGLVLSLARMDALVSLDARSGVARAQPGLVTARLMEAADAAGWLWGPDPNSWQSCTIGGNIACNAGGPRALRYGVTRDHVLGLEVVLADGEILRLGRQTAKGVAGYDLVSLFVGSEGTLGVVTEATLRLVPKPGAVATMLVTFASVEAALGGIEALHEAHVAPRALELFDEVALAAIGAQPALRLPARAGAALLVELEGRTAAEVEAAIIDAGERLQAIGGQAIVATREQERRQLWAVRALVSEALRALCGRKRSEDVVVPRARLAEAIGNARAIGRAHGFSVSTYGHAGDGNLHTNVLYRDPAELPAVERCLDDLVRDALALGGTVSGEHGIGLAKRTHLTWEQPAPLLALQRRLKALFDPRGILNPGKVL